MLRISMLLSICLATSCSQPQVVNREITQKELFAHVDLLASDSLQGRLPGTPFDRVAAKYIKDQMDISGLKLLGKNGYQFFDFIARQEHGSNNYLTIAGEKLVYGKDFTVFPFSGSDSLSASVVFVGYGFSMVNETITWDEYGTVNVSGRWALVLRGDPDSKKPESQFSLNASDRNKAMLAKDQGASGVLLVSGNEYDPSDELIGMGEKSFDIGIPVIHITRRVADLIFRVSGMNVSTIEKKILTARQPSSFAIKCNVSGRTDVIQQKKATQNVVGMIEGTDLKDEYVVVGAHFDHLGMGGKSTSSRVPDTLAIHNGADDNASGVSALLEIAQKIAVEKPRRSIVFVAFGAEELGLLGSRFFIENPLIPIESIVAMVNIDMIGRLSAENNLQVGGVKTSLESETILDKLNENAAFSLSKSGEGYGPSDHAPFYGKDIPVFFFTTGPHHDYHTPFDKVNLVNFEGMHRIALYIDTLVSHLANAPQKLSFQEAGPKSSPTRHGRDLRVRLGIMPDVSGANNNGLKVLAATENNPAHIAGIRKDDVIVAINGLPVNNIHDYMYRLKGLKPGTTISVEFIRGDERKLVLVQL